MRHKTREVKLYWQLIALALIMIVIAVAWFAVARPATGQGGDYAVPNPTPTPLYIEATHGQRIYIRCGASSGESTQPAGQFASPQLGVDVLILDCEPFGSTVAGEGMAVELKDGE